MSELRMLYAQGLENHAELVEHSQQVTSLSIQVHKAVTGNEGFQEVLGTLGEGMKSLGGGVLTTAGWVGGKTVSAFAHVLGGAGNLLTRAFSDNDVLIKKIITQFSKEDESEIKFSKDKVKLITSTGDHSMVSKDMDVLLEALESVDKHAKDLLTFLDKRMAVLRELKGVKTTEDIYKVIDKHEELKYPGVSFPHHDGAKYSSDVLPGGKVMVFDSADIKYLMNGDSPEGSAGSATVSKSDISDLLTKLDKVNAMHKRFKQSYESYLSFIKSWGEMVKTVESNMSQLERVSKSAQNDAEKLLGGEPAALAFYSGFTPRVICYTDRYIHGVLGVFV